MLRSPELQTFLDATQYAITAPTPGDAERRLADRIFNGLEAPGESASPQSVQLPVCDYLAPALERAREKGGSTEALADALSGIAPQLVWACRSAVPDTDPTFRTSYAGAEIVGNDGLEIRNDIWIGVSLLAPHSQYPDHRHPPEEIYSVLSAGEWRQESGPWHTPGIGGTVHNPPNVVHSMRSKTLPLLAVWCLWTGKSD